MSTNLHVSICITRTHSDVSDFRPWKASPAIKLIWLLLKSLKNEKEKKMISFTMRIRIIRFKINWIYSGSVPEIQIGFHRNRSDSWRESNSLSFDVNRSWKFWRPSRICPPWKRWLHSLEFSVVGEGLSGNLGDLILLQSPGKGGKKEEITSTNNEENKTAKKMALLFTKIHLKNVWKGSISLRNPFQSLWSVRMASKLLIASCG